MARTVKKRKMKTGAPGGGKKLNWGDLRFPGENTHYWLVVMALIWGCIILAALGWYSSGKVYWQWVYLGLWPIGSLLLVNFMADKPRRKQLKEIGPQCQVRANSNAALHRKLLEVCQCLEVRTPPKACLLEEEAAYIYSMPGGSGTIILTSGLASQLRPEELGVVLAREIAHLKFGHLRLQRAIGYIRTTSNTIGLLFGPVWLWAMMMGEWLDLTEFTADRAALAVSGDPRLVDATIAKTAAARDPQSGITPAEIEEYISMPPQDSLDSAELEQRFKLDRFINEEPALKERIAQVVEYYQSEEGIEFLNALAAKQGRPPIKIIEKAAPVVEDKSEKHWASFDQ